MSKKVSNATKKKVQSSSQSFSDEPMVFPKKSVKKPPAKKTVKKTQKSSESNEEVIVPTKKDKVAKQPKPTEEAKVSTNELTEESNEDTISFLTDSDFMNLLPPPSIVDQPVVIYRLPKSENTLSFVKCPHSACNNVISSMSEMFQREIDNAQRKSMDQNGRHMTTAEYNIFVSTTYDKYGNIFDNGALDRSVTVFDNPTKQLIKAYSDEFFNKNRRQMNQDEYNSMIESITNYNDDNKIKQVKDLYFKYFSKRMTIRDYEDYTGESNTYLGLVIKEIIRLYDMDISDEKYYELIDRVARNEIDDQEKDFYMKHGREIIAYVKFTPLSDALKRVTSTNSFVLEKECCRVNVMQRIIVPQGRDFNDRRIDEEGIKHGIKHGNVVLQKLSKPIPYNPYTFRPELLEDEILKAKKPIKRSTKLLEKIKKQETFFADMPPTDEDEFQEEPFVPFVAVSNEKITHKVHTGVRNLITYKTTGRRIIAR